MAKKVKEKRKGIVIQTEFQHGGSFIRIAGNLFATSHWPIINVNVGDEIAIFTKSTKADSFIVGEVAGLIEHEDCSPRRFTILFWGKPKRAVKRKAVLTTRGSHYYEIKKSNYVT
jgi:4-aminobutyrate aminotransferase-like enzyme